MRSLAIVCALAFSTFSTASWATNDIFGHAVCVTTNGNYHLVKGDSSCPQIATIKGWALTFQIFELGIAANVTDNYVTEADGDGGALKGSKVLIPERAGEMDCFDLGLNCRGSVEIQKNFTLNWSPTCGKVLIQKDERYTQTSNIVFTNVVRDDKMSCLYTK